MGKAIPSLSTNGWITEVSAKVDYILSCLASTDALQSSTMLRVSSIPAILQKNKLSIADTTSEIKNAFIQAMGAYFDAVNVEATYELVDPTESRTLAKITILANFTEDGKNYSVSRVLSFFNGKFKEIAEANNG